MKLHVGTKFSHRIALWPMKEYVLIFRATKLSNHIPQGKDGSENQLGVILGAEALRLRLTIGQTVRLWWIR